MPTLNATCWHVVAGCGPSVRAAGDAAAAGADNSVTSEGATAADVATLVRAHYPGVPVLFMSGYSEPVFSGGQPVEHLLPKPFTAKTLLATVDDLVASRAAAAAS
mgnify:CR=1 FL=1